MKLRTRILQELLVQDGSSITELFLAENDASHGYQLAAQIDFANTDAIYAPSDMIALGILHYCYENRIQVPQEVELLAIGNGHPIIDHYLNPSLSIIDIPLEEMAQECVELMDYLFENRDSASIERLVEPRAVIQESCQPVDFSD